MDRDSTESSQTLSLKGGEEINEDGPTTVAEESSDQLVSNYIVPLQLCNKSVF